MIKILVVALTTLSFSALGFAQAKPATPATPATPSAPATEKKTEMKSEKAQATVLTGQVTSVDAKAGTLAVMISCPKSTLAEVEPILKTFGRPFYTGEKPGLAQTAKLANNLLAAAAMVLSSEAIVMGVKAGLDPKVLIDIINAGSGRNSATQDKFPRAVLTRSFDFGFATGLSYKDVRLCVDEAEAMGVPMVCGAVVRQMLAITNAKYGASSDFTSIAKVLEEWAGVEMRG